MSPHTGQSSAKPIFTSWGNCISLAQEAGKQKTGYFINYGPTLAGPGKQKFTCFSLLSWFCMEYMHINYMLTSFNHQHILLIYNYNTYPVLEVLKLWSTFLNCQNISKDSQELHFTLNTILCQIFQTEFTIKIHCYQFFKSKICKTTVYNQPTNYKSCICVATKNVYIMIGYLYF